MEYWHLLLRRSPEWIRKSVRRYLQNFDNLKNASRNNREVFSEIYRKNLWGKGSGPGSHHADLTAPYLDFIREVLAESGKDSVVVDLGCGDMNISRHYLDLCGKFIGVDVVPDLIQHHQQANWPSSVQFDCLDIVDDDLPDGDIAFLRQVLQHLSNSEIKKILPKLRKYKSCFITEHHPDPASFIIPNKDLVHGLWNRTTDHSGVYLDKPPFNISPENLHVVLETPGVNLLGKRGGIFRTYRLDGPF